MNGREKENCLRLEQNQIEEGILIDNQTGALSQQIAYLMKLAEEGGFEKDNRMRLAMIDQNVVRGKMGEGLRSKSKTRGKKLHEFKELSRRRWDRTNRKVRKIKRCEIKK